MDLETKPIYAVVPLSNLGQLIAEYLIACGVVKEVDKIHSIDLPIQSDDENNVTIRLGVIEGIVN